MKKERVVYLDLLRILCYLMVTSYHFAVAARSCSLDAPVDVYQGTRYIVWSPIAVSCFFMASGASLIYQYGGSSFSIREYYKKRFYGIYPLFWLAYGIVFLDYFYRARSMPSAPKIHFLLSVIGLDGYLNGYVETFYMIGEWFLGVLIMLYILFPLYRLIMLKCKYILPVVFTAGTVVLFYHNPFPMVIEMNLIMCSMYFVAGMLIEMLRSGMEGRKAVILRRVAAAAGVLTLVVMFLIDIRGYRINGYFRIFLHSVAFYLIIIEVAEWLGERARKFIVAIGRHSYAYFLLHHVFLYRYLAHFAGVAMNRSNTLFLFLSSVLYIYLLAVLLDALYAYLRNRFRQVMSPGSKEVEKRQAGTAQVAARD